jgi:DNA-binding transcriptional ArsR family regulator
MNIADFHSQAQNAAGRLRALSNDSRLMILCLLSKGEHSVGDLERQVGLSQSALSQHLARLRRDGLVQTRRQSQTIYYALKGDKAVRVIDVLAGLFCPLSIQEGTDETQEQVSVVKTPGKQGVSP